MRVNIFFSINFVSCKLGVSLLIRLLSKYLLFSCRLATVANDVLGRHGRQSATTVMKLGSSFQRTVINH